MKRLGLFFFTLALSATAHAVLVDPRLRVQIKEAFLGHRHEPGANAFCACVATKHFRSAKQMPDYGRATRDLDWVLRYYRAHDPKDLARLRANPDNLIEYDAIIGRACRRESKS